MHRLSRKEKKVTFRIRPLLITNGTFFVFLKAYLKAFTKTFTSLLNPRALRKCLRENNFLRYWFCWWNGGYKRYGRQASSCYFGYSSRRDAGSKMFSHQRKMPSEYKVRHLQKLFLNFHMVLLERTHARGNQFYSGLPNC